MSYQSFIAASLLLTNVLGHMVINDPLPYSTPQLVSTSPLNPLLFPCQRGIDVSYLSDNATVATAGETLPLSFTGSAVHGGGSCQVSVFKLGTDGKVTANPDDFKVIHTIIGGCPATGVGNLAVSGADSDGRPTAPECTSNDQTECRKKYQIPIPKDLPNGDYVYSWTWLNKIGNREFYQNCAPIKVVGGGSDDSFLSTLPGIFFANIPSAGCTTNPGVLDIPNPGNSVERSALDPADPNALGTCKAGAPPAANAPPASNSTSAASIPTPAATTSATTASSSTPVSSDAVTAPDSSSTEASTSAAPDIVEVTSTQVVNFTSTVFVTASPSATSVVASAAPTSSLSTYSDDVIPVMHTCNSLCTTEGAIVCLEDDRIGICKSGCIEPQEFSLGFLCKDNTVVKRSPPSFRFGKLRTRSINESATNQDSSFDSPIVDVSSLLTINHFVEKIKIWLANKPTDPVLPGSPMNTSSSQA